MRKSKAGNDSYAPDGVGAAGASSLQWERWAKDRAAIPALEEALAVLLERERK